MPKYYTVTKIVISEKDLKERYVDYIKEVNLGNLPSPALTYDDYINYDSMYEQITMKCLECRFQDKYEHSHMLMSMIANNTPFPIEICPACGKLSFMPFDVYRKIKGYRD